jgi:hypothetical protein
MQVCDKISYPNHQAAQNAIIGNNKRKKRSLHSYKCKECGLYHLASNGKRKSIKNLRSKEILLSQVKIPKPKKSKGRGKQQSKELATEKLLSKEMVQMLKLLIEHNSTNQATRIPKLY